MNFTEARKLLGERKSTYGLLHAEMDVDEDMIESTTTWRSKIMDNYLQGLPKGYRAQIPPIAKDGVNIQVNQVMVGETPAVKVLLSPGNHRDQEKRRRQAMVLEKKLQSLLWCIDTYSSESPIRSFMEHCYGLGMGVLRYPLTYDKWMDDPFLMENGKRRKPRNAAEREIERRWQSKRSRTLPWAVSVVHPRNVYMDPFHDPPYDVIVEEKVGLAAFKKRYPHLPFDGKSGTGTLLSYCSEEEYGLWLNGHSLLTKKHGADEGGCAPNPQMSLWYVFAYSGYGRVDKKGSWEARVKGVVRDARDVICMYIAALNQVQAMRGVYAFPPMEGIGATKELADEELGGFSFGPGALATHSEQVRLSVIDVPEVPPVVLQTIEQAEHFLERHFGPEILRGIYAADQTARQQETRLSQAKGPLKAGRQSGQQAVAQMLMDMCHAIKHDLDGPVTLVDATESIVELSADDIPDGYRIVVNFAPPTKEERMQEFVQQSERLRTGTISRRRLLEYDPEIEDPDEEYAQILSEKVDESQPVLDLLGTRAVEETKKALGIVDPPAPPAEPPAAPEAPPAEPAAPVPVGQYGPAPIG